MRLVLTFCALFFLILALPAHADKYSVRVHTSAAFSNEDADTNFAGAVDLLKTVDGAGDVSCIILWSRDGDVGTFDVGTGSIDTADDQAQVRSVDCNIKVVRYINFCGTEPVTALGCSDVSGTSMIVVKGGDPAIDVVVWGHEYGHNKGLHHRDEQFALMAPYAKAEDRQVNSDECSKFEAFFLDKLLITSLDRGNSAERPIPAKDMLPNIQTFIHKQYIHGIPISEARRYTKETIPILLEMLNDPREQNYLSNIITTLCLIGDDRVVGPLIKSFERGEGKLSYMQFAGKRAFLLHFGILVNRTGTKEGLDYLLKTVGSASRENLVTSWTGPFGEQGAELNRLLRNVGLWSLGFAAKTESRALLKDIYKRSEGIRKTQNQVLDAIKLSDQIQQNGLDAYFRTQEMSHR